jgi:hypothetical protein
VGCELVSHILEGYGDSFTTTIPRVVFNIVEKLAIQGTVGMLGGFLVQFAVKIKGSLELVIAFFLLVLLGIAIHGPMAMTVV